MSATHCLALIRPYDPIAESRVDVRLASASIREITGLGDAGPWQPAMVRAPTLSLQLFNGDFVAAVSPGSASIAVAMQRLTEAPAYSAADRFYWPGAEVELRLGKIGDAWPWPLRFRGRIENLAGSDRTLNLVASVDAERFSANVLSATYTGNGGPEGGADIRGQAKPLAIGWPRNVEPVAIDVNNSVYQFSGYGPIEAVEKLYERGSDFGAPSGDYASYAALVAADIPPGRWATCLASGLVRLGAPAAGVITGDVRGHKVNANSPRLTGSIIDALATIAGVDSTYFEVGSLVALNTNAPYEVSLFLDTPVSFIDIARDMVLACNHQAGVSLTGTFFVAKIDLGADAVITLDAQGGADPQVVDSREESTSPPYARTVFGAARSWRVHSPDEIAFYADLVDQGVYSATETYREGHIVSMPDASRWLYVAVTPQAGVTPGTNTSVWVEMSPAIPNDRISVTASTAAIRYNNADQIISGDVTLTVTRRNTSETPYFRFITTDGTIHATADMTAAELSATYPTAFASSGPDNVVLKQSWIDALMQGYGGGMRVEARVAGSLDTATLTKVREGLHQVTAGDHVPNQGVDWSAVVPGSLQWRASYIESADLGPANSLDTGIVAVGVTGTGTPSTIVTLAEIVQTGWSSAAVGFDTDSDGVNDYFETWSSTFQIYYRMNNGPWIDTGIRQTYSNTGLQGNFTWNSSPTPSNKFSPASSGTLQMGVRWLGAHANPAGTGAIYDRLVRFEVVNWK